MAVVKVYRTFEEEGDNVSEVHRYVVQVDSRTDTVQTARTASDGTTSIPAQGSVLAGTGWLADVTARRRPKDPMWFDVTVTYKAPAFGGPAEEKPSEGGKWNKTIRGRGVVYEEEVFQDRDGVDIVNTAGDRYAHGVLHEYHDEEFVVEFDTNEYDLDYLAQCRGKLNESQVTLTVKGVTRTFDAETLKLVDGQWNFTWEFTDDYNTPDLHIQLIFHYRDPSNFDDGNPWAARKVSEGFYFIEGGSGERVRITDETGQKVVVPWFLDENGEVLGEGQDAVLTAHEHIRTADFGPLLENV